MGKASKKDKIDDTIIESSKEITSEQQLEKEKDSTIDKLIADVNDMLGIGHACRASECVYESEILSSGCIRFDLALRCGGLPIPDGKIIEIHGKVNSGKSTLALSAIAEMHKKFPDSIALYVDLEHTLETKQDLLHASRLGVDLRRLIPISASCGEDTIVALETFLIHPDVRLAVVDTVRFMMPAKELDKNVDKNQKMSALATFLTQNIPKIARLINLDKNRRKSIIFLNQVYTDINAYGTYKPDVVPGGNIIPAYSHVRVYLKRTQAKSDRIYLDANGVRSWTESIPDKSMGSIGYGVDGTIIKSKMFGDAGTTQNTFRFNIIAEEGIDKDYDLLSSGIVTGLFELSGKAYYKYKDTTMNGKGSFVDYIKTLDRTMLIKEIMQRKEIMPMKGEE